MRSRHFPVAWGTVRRVQLAPRHRHLQRNPQQSDNHHHRLRSPATIPRVHRSVCSSRFITWLRQVCCRRSLHAKQSRPVTRLHGVLGRQHGLRRCNLQREMPSCKAHKAAARRQKRQPEPVSRVLYCLVHALVALLPCACSCCACRPGLTQQQVPGLRRGLLRRPIHSMRWRQSSAQRYLQVAIGVFYVV